jgi:hypothetical protein
LSRTTNGYAYYVTFNDSNIQSNGCTIKRSKYYGPNQIPNYYSSNIPANDFANYLAYHRPITSPNR